MTTGPFPRAVRAAAFAAVCVTTTALGHALMAAAPLPWWAVLAAFGATGPVGWWLTGRERGASLITGTTVLAQLGLHALFDLSQPGLSHHVPGAQGLDAVRGMTEMAETAGRATMPGMVTMPGSVTVPGAGHVDATAAGALTHPAHLDMTPSVHGSLGMLLAHTLAAILCGLWLWRGEAAAFQLARSFAAALFAPLLLVLWTPARTGRKPPARRVTTDAPALGPSGTLLHHVVSRRGPPALPVCC
ncbi:hypothetical protein [Streptomyces kronopolitis]|uniref:hypothetical protein n=1 Tax=Streptomyces kronopolitis TaxID=1612435 RepID=UPI003437B7D4